MTKCKKWLSMLSLPVEMLLGKFRKGHYDLSTVAGESLGLKEENVWKDYPRPQMKRENWMSLNGTWMLDGDQIRVPFPPQSQLSNYGKKVKEHFTYEKQFTIAGNLKGERILLHFVKWENTGHPRRRLSGFFL